MSAYLIVDVEDLLGSLQSRSFAVDLHDLANRLRGTAALASGLANPDLLKAVAFADWSKYNNSTVQQIFEGVGFETFNLTDRKHMVESLVIQFFSVGSGPIDELILVSTSPDILLLLKKVKIKRSARVRMWGDREPESEDIIYQPLEAILGIQSKTVSLYIDFENIAISLNENGYAVNIDRLIEGLSGHASAHGQIKRMAAYAPWGQRGSLPPLVDDMGREVSDDAPSRLALSNIDPVYNLPGKNSADMRIAKDVLADSVQPSTADIFIIASGDRDFNEVFGALRNRNKQVIVWGVRGSTSRMVESNPSLQIEYLDDFLALQRHEAVGQMYSTSQSTPAGAANAFTPSQWSTVVLQYDRLSKNFNNEGVTIEALQEQLRRVSAVISPARGRDLVLQAIAMGILRTTRAAGMEFVTPAADHSIVERTRLVRDRVVIRVANTLDVRGWEYVNYGFLLKGIAMDRDLDRPGLNIDDTWRSIWVDCLVREGLLQREMVPHRHNPDDLVPVIKLPTDDPRSQIKIDDPAVGEASYDDLDFSGGVHSPRDAETDMMMKRIIVSVDQFTSYRGFTWCPLGSLHRRLRAYDSGVVFQRSVEWLLELKAVVVDAYDNPQSNYRTKGISLIRDSDLAKEVLDERDEFIRSLLNLYEQRLPINFMTLSGETNLNDSALELWLSIMQAENVLNPVPGKPGLFSLFRTHHTVNQVAESRDEKNSDKTA
ncbi:MAG: NYN domain-containing protein [Anaerolineae bacterium]|nr:NYN domain-containing protein [Anaerolineae bacterium]